jgi:hypothetical protein
VTADLVGHLATVLFASGGGWLAVREIAKQVGETKREHIRQDAETMRLTIARVMPLPEAMSRPIEEKSEKLDAA